MSMCIHPAFQDFWCQALEHVAQREHAEAHGHADEVQEAKARKLEPRPLGCRFRVRSCVFRCRGFASSQLGALLSMRSGL